MNIQVKIIDNESHRTAIGGGKITGADWYFDEKGNLQVRISKMSDERYEMALALHEIAEALLCHLNGVTVEDVDRFDTKYDDTHDAENNAGDDPSAPYAIEHNFATAIERIFVGAAKFNWEIYDQELEKL